MGSSKKRKRQPRRRKRRSAVWLGGRFLTPLSISGEGDPYSPEIDIWFELPAGAIHMASFLNPHGPDRSFSDSLGQAMEKPAIGPPRQPKKVRIADEKLAREIRDSFPDIEVLVAPTPELDKLLLDLLTSLSKNAAEEASYLEGGRIPPDLIEELFHAADLLYVLAPWKSATDGQLIRLDIPELEIEAACVSIIGALGESIGFLIFPSIEGYDAFASAAELSRSPTKPIDLGTNIRSLTFERGADLPGKMRQEAIQHGWTVRSPDAYPVVEHRGRKGTLLPVTERDIRIVTACATSLSAFAAKHGGIFEKKSFEPICESYLDDENLEVRFTLPFEAGPLFDVNEA